MKISWQSRPESRHLDLFEVPAGGLLDWNCAIEVLPDYESRNRHPFLQFFKPVQALPGRLYRFMTRLSG